MSLSPSRNLLVMNVQMSVSLLTTIILCRLLFPGIVQAEFAVAVLPVAILHMFRFIGMTVVMPGQLDDAISHKAKVQIAIGDLAVAVTAVLLTFAIVEGFSDGAVRALAWLFVITCLTDMAVIQRFFIREQFWDKKMGVVWLFQVLLSVPMVLGEFFVLYRLVVV
ncbi:MAG: hypothetical protein KDJ67_03855 [Nitratireductor sp.]|nr:hypothetical protein [Nitratireductor sp.]